MGSIEVTGRYYVFLKITLLLVDGMIPVIATSKLASSIKFYSFPFVSPKNPFEVEHIPTR
jgi:hypothetical protein